MLDQKLLKAFYPEWEFSRDNPEQYYLLRLANRAGKELLEEYLETLNNGAKILTQP